MDQRKIDNLSLVIPCLNEPENIPLLIKQLSKTVTSIPFKLEVIIVDGCSDDDTAKILINEFKQLNPNNFKLMLQKERMGYGHDIVVGLKAAKYDVLAWTHADMQTDINDAILGFNLYRSFLDSNNNTNIIVKGHRVGRPFLDTMLTYGMQFFTLLTLNMNLSDINAQPKIFSKEFFELHIKNSAPNDYSLDLFLLAVAKKNKYNLHSFPVHFKKRRLGEAKGGGGSLRNRWNLMKRTSQYILKLRQELSTSKNLNP